MVVFVAGLRFLAVLLTSYGSNFVEGRRQCRLDTIFKRNRRAVIGLFCHVCYVIQSTLCLLAKLFIFLEIFISFVSL